MRKHGFSRPFHKLQVVSWIYFAFLGLPLIPQNEKLIIGLLYSLSTLAVILTAVFCTLSDPTDPAIAEIARATFLSKPVDTKKYPKICRICKNYVNLDSKHCRECERCVLHFDHHCKWLNNCIGKKNYRMYSFLLVSFEMFNVVILICGGVVINGMLEKNVVFDNYLIYSRNTGHNFEVYVFFLFLMEVMSSLAALTNGQLITFHLYLAFKKKTTYEFILQRRKRKDQYKISTIKVISANEAVEEVPLEEVYEPYVENSQYKQEVVNELKVKNCNKILPSLNSEKLDETPNDNNLNITFGNTKVSISNDYLTKKSSIDNLVNNDCLNKEISNNEM